MFLYLALNRHVWECEYILCTEGTIDLASLICTITTPKGLLLIGIHSLNLDTVPALPIHAPYPLLNSDPPLLPVYNPFFSLLFSFLNTIQHTILILPLLIFIFISQILLSAA